MKAFDYDLLPREGLALLTVPEIDGTGEMYLADFRDQRVLVFKPTGHFLGFSKERGIRLCKGPASMIDGMWTAVEDVEAARRFPDVRLEVDSMDFVMI